MLGAVHRKGHLTVLPGGRSGARDPRTVRAARRYDRLVRTVFADGRRVILPAIPSGDGAA